MSQSSRRLLELPCLRAGGRNAGLEHWLCFVLQRNSETKGKTGAYSTSWCFCRASSALYIIAGFAKPASPYLGISPHLDIIHSRPSGRCHWVRLNCSPHLYVNLSNGFVY
jgi:hypothetical protein